MNLKLIVILLVLFSCTAIPQTLSSIEELLNNRPSLCIDLLKKYEGFRDTAYPDPLTGGKPYTIGYGFTRINGREVKKGDYLSREDADKMVHQIIEPYRDAIDETVKVALAWHQKEALTCFIYNVGTTNWSRSSALRLLNQGKYKEAIHAAGRYVNPGSHVEQVLKKRRNAEKAMFLGQI